jgi:hypothetical protein
MTFFILCAVSRHLSLLLFLWFVFYNVLVDVSIEVSCQFCPLAIMPVTTRSQAKLETLTGSTDGLLFLSSGPTGSIDELSRLQHTNTGSTDECVSFLDTTISIPSSLLLSSDPSLVSLPLSYTAPPALEFQNTTLENLNLEISHEHLFPGTERRHLLFNCLIIFPIQIFRIWRMITMINRRRLPRHPKI